MTRLNTSEQLNKVKHGNTCQKWNDVRKLLNRRRLKNIYNVCAYVRVYCCVSGITHVV